MFKNGNNNVVSNNRITNNKEYNKYKNNKKEGVKNTIIYGVGDASKEVIADNHQLTREIKVYDDAIPIDIDAQVALFFNQSDVVSIPNKVEYTLRRHLSKYLTHIHPDREVAKELCLLILSQLNSTNFDILYGKNPDGWKRLKAKYLRNLVKLDGRAYKRIIEVLQIPTQKGQLLEVIKDDVEGLQCRRYRFGEAYRAKGITTYQLKTSKAKKAYKSYQQRIVRDSLDNPICKNLMQFYTEIEMPSIDVIQREATKLIKEDYRTRQGKLLKRLNKHSKKYFKDAEQFSFVEDSIAIYEYLTSNGLMVPHVSSEKNGGRVIDSITLMPSWIRKLIKINGRKLVEGDYKCLHPNNAISLYGGKTEFLTHGHIAEYLQMDVLEVKRMHLSFFNKTTHQMKQSPLWKYYEAKEPQMLQNLVDEKLKSEYKYRVTSRRLLEKEVAIMTDVIQRLNDMDIYVGYVYDALICCRKHQFMVEDVMNSVVLEHGVKTKAKTESTHNYIPFKERSSESAAVTQQKLTGELKRA